jgi:hypothetical protein
LIQNRPDADSIPGRGRAYLDSIHRFAEWQAGSYDFPIEDIDAVFSVNRFPSAIEGTRQEWQGIHYIDAHPIDMM